MVVDPRADLQFDSGQPTGRAVTNALRQIACFFSNFGTTVDTAEDDIKDPRIFQTVRALVEQLRELVRIEAAADSINRQEGVFSLARLGFKEADGRARALPSADGLAETDAADEQRQRQQQDASAKPADKKKKTGLLGGRLINGVLEREHGGGGRERGGARPRRRRELAEKLAEVLEGAQSDTD